MLSAAAVHYKRGVIGVAPREKLNVPFSHPAPCQSPTDSGPVSNRAVEGALVAPVDAVQVTLQE